MARVTVEDCIDKVENRFDLVLLASHRARMISSGSQITVDRDNDKNPVVALREPPGRSRGNSTRPGGYVPQGKRFARLWSLRPVMISLGYDIRRTCRGGPKANDGAFVHQPAADAESVPGAGAA